jgi:hypothetical protein
MSKRKSGRGAGTGTATSELVDVAATSTNGKARSPRSVEYVVVGKPIAGGPPECVQTKPTIGQVKKYYAENKDFLSRYYTSVAVWKIRKVPAEVLNT